MLKYKYHSIMIFQVMRFASQSVYFFVWWWRPRHQKRTAIHSPQKWIMSKIQWEMKNWILRSGGVCVSFLHNHQNYVPRGVSIILRNPGLGTFSVYQSRKSKIIWWYSSTIYWCLQDTYVIYPSFLCESKI